MKVPETASHTKVRMYFDQLQANMHVIGAMNGWLYQYQQALSPTWKCPPPLSSGNKRKVAKVDAMLPTFISNNQTGSLITPMPRRESWTEEILPHALHYKHATLFWRDVVLSQNMFSSSMF